MTQANPYGISGAHRKDEPQKYLVMPLPKVEAALLTVADSYDDNDAVGIRIAAAFRQLATELHHWL